MVGPDVVPACKSGDGWKATVGAGANPASAASTSAEASGTYPDDNELYAWFTELDAVVIFGGASTDDTIDEMLRDIFSLPRFRRPRCETISGNVLRTNLRKSADLGGVIDRLLTIGLSDVRGTPNHRKSSAPSRRAIIVVVLSDRPYGIYAYFPILDGAIRSQTSWTTGENCTCP